MRRAFKVRRERRWVELAKWLRSRGLPSCQCGSCKRLVRFIESVAP
jgi:hypothetical protein